MVKIDSLTNDMKESNIVLDANQVVEGQDVLEIFQCIICLNIPSLPIKECD